MEADRKFFTQVNTVVLPQLAGVLLADTVTGHPEIFQIWPLTRTILLT